MCSGGFFLFRFFGSARGRVTFVCDMQGDCACVLVVGSGVGCDGWIAKERGQLRFEIIVYI